MPRISNLHLSRGASHLAVLALLLVAFHGAAPASTLEMAVMGIDPNRGMTVPILADGVAESGWAGLIDVTFNGVPYYADCVDLFHNISVGDRLEVVPEDPDVVSNGQRAAWVFRLHFQAATTSALGAALQLTMWDIVHDGGDGLDAGRVRAQSSMPADIVAIVNQYLSESVGQFSTDAAVYTSVLYGYQKQRLISARIEGDMPGDPTPEDSWARPNPEPQTLVLLGSGLCLIGFSRKRARKFRP